MKIRLDNLKIPEFDKFLKFAKKQEDNVNFKVILWGGIDIFENGEKIAMIYRLNNITSDGFKEGDILANTDVSKKINVQVKIEKAGRFFTNPITFIN